MLKHIKYLKYVLRHKWYVFIECINLGIPLRGFMHDMSKFFPSEWFPYANFFYGKSRPVQKGFEIKNTHDAAEEAFDTAWLKHIHHNPHHWQYWILRQDDGGTKEIQMSYNYVLEMVAD